MTLSTCSVQFNHVGVTEIDLEFNREQLTED